MSSAFIAGAAESSNVKFLPRFGALLLDFIVVIVAAQLLATAAHHLSRGSVQGAFDAGNPRRRGLPFRKAVIRNVVMHAGILVSTVIVFVYQLASEDIEGSVSVARFLYLSVLGWILWNSGRLLLGSETLYDLAAGTTVVRK
jgi:hypothetical protein